MMFLVVRWYIGLYLLTVVSYFLTSTFFFTLTFTYEKGTDERKLFWIKACQSLEETLDVIFWGAMLGALAFIAWVLFDISVFGYVKT